MLVLSRGGPAVKVLILQHIACEPPGVYEDILVERGAALHRVELDAGQELPDWQGSDAILAMGGPMSVNDDDTLPWLRAEKRWLREAVLAGKPFWGVCLGAQLLAASLGARVYGGAMPEIGIMPVYLTSEAQNDAVFSGTPRELLTFQWHGETLTCPWGRSFWPVRRPARTRRFAARKRLTAFNSTSRSRRLWRSNGPMCRTMRRHWNEHLAQARQVR